MARGDRRRGTRRGAHAATPAQQLVDFGDALLGVDLESGDRRAGDLRSGDGRVQAAICTAARTSRIRGELTTRYSAELTETIALPRIDVRHVYTESFGYAELERVAAYLERSLASAT